MSTAAPRSIAAVILSCLLAAQGSSPARASETDFLERFRGTWSGSGKVQREGSSQPWWVTCSVTGNPTKDGISAHGNCSAIVIFRRQIGVDVSYDPRSGTYSGIYTGARIGPARLIGTRTGDALNLRIEWPRPVNGDTRAAMVIRNDGHGTLRITVADNLAPGGPVRQTSEIVLARR